MRKRFLLGAIVSVAAAAIPASSALAVTWIPGTCAGSTSVCVTSQNVTGYVDPTPRGEFTTAANYDFAQPLVAGNGGAWVNNNVNSIRNKGTFVLGGQPLNRACFYFTAGYIGFATSVSAAQPGWYDNSSTGLSSYKRIFGTHADCPR